MKVQLISTYANAEISAAPGAVIDVPPKLAKQLIDDANAVEFDDPTAEEPAPKKTTKKKAASKPAD